MNVFLIAWRSIQHRGLGSLLTIISMALGVMMVVAVLTIHGVVDTSFKNNNSFGYNMIVGARGGGLQLTLNSVYYLSRPVEAIPYEYYLAFCDGETRERELQRSIGFEARQTIDDTQALIDSLGVASCPVSHALIDAATTDSYRYQQDEAMRIRKDGVYRRWTHIAVPMCLGDSYVHPSTGDAFKCVGTKPSFFTDLVLDVDTEEKFEFAQGRNFIEESPEHGYFECVIGAAVARRCGLGIGDRVQATHGDPSSDSSHLHEQNYTIVGVLNGTGTPHDRVVFLNMEGFFLMEDHAKPVEDDSILGAVDRDEAEDDQDAADIDPDLVDPFDDENDTFENALQTTPPPAVGNQREAETDDLVDEPLPPVNPDLQRVPLPVEQREVTSILVRTSLKDPYGLLPDMLPAQIGEGDLERTLDWTPFRPVKSQKAAQGVNPVSEVTRLFEGIVDPIRWLLLALTSMICVVSSISIVVGIYNSMNQRQHEIAVMRALGASRGKVMSIMLCESILLAVAGGLLGWIAGHGLNALLSPIVEDRTGVQVGFFSFAPGLELSKLPVLENFASVLGKASVSSEILLVPVLVLLAILVGLYPAVSAYRTDVSKSLGK
ncbi:MAG: ABC transporter permease [Planctomycetota bacterium]